MDFSQELCELEKVYFNEAVASEQKVDREFKSLVVRMESFLREYKNNVKYSKLHNDLMEKINEANGFDDEDEDDEE